MFKNLFAKKKEAPKYIDEKILSPIAGKVIAIEQVADPAFSEKMLGDGLAIRPSLEMGVILAPCDAKVQNLQDTKHAVVLVTEQNTEILIHVGLETVTLKGEGFKAFTKAGSNVKKGDKLLEVNFVAIASKVPSIDVIVTTTSLSEDKELEKTSQSNVGNLEDFITVVKKNSKLATVDSFSNQTGVNSVVTTKVKIVNKNGIHARPASNLVKTVTACGCEINLKKDDKTINAKSVIGILSLGLKYDDEVEIIAIGKGAKEAIAIITQAFVEGLGEGEHVYNNSKTTTPPAPSSKSHPTESMGEIDFSHEVDLQGVIASPGLAIGKSFLLQENNFSIQEDADNKDAEIQKLKEVLVKTKEEITKDIQNAQSLRQNTQVEIFQAHLEILQDITLYDEAKRIIDEQGKTAAFAWKESIKSACEALESTNNRLLIERKADLKDIERRVLKIMLGIIEDNITYPQDSIIIAEDLIPSDLNNFNRNVVGVALAKGSTTSHAVLMLRNMGIPSLVALGIDILKVPDSTNIILDGSTSKIIVNASQDKLNSIKSQKEASEKVKAENLKNARAKAITKDNHEIKVYSNISNDTQAPKTYELGAEGIGLLRTEFLFFNSLVEPTIEEQRNLYQVALDAMQGGPIIVRTLDVGGDKPINYMPLPAEDNPIVGVRGIRNYSKNLNIIKHQLKALLSVKPVILCKIMVPMVSEIYEIIKFKELVENIKKELNITDKIKIGTMIEVPSSALMAEQFAQHVDFFSIGTNDLTQYTLAMDRGNSHLTGRLKNLNPAVLKLIKMTVDGGNKYNIPTAVCGAMASELISVPILIGLGIKELSVSMNSIPDVKALIRKLDYEKCKKIAAEALMADSPEQVEQIVIKNFSF